MGRTDLMGRVTASREAGGPPRLRGGVVGEDDPVVGEMDGAVRCVGDDVVPPGEPGLEVGDGAAGSSARGGRGNRIVQD